MAWFLKVGRALRCASSGSPTPSRACLSVLGLLLLAAALPAQPTNLSGSEPAAHRLEAPPLPLLPKSQNPVEFFRELLAASSRAERDNLLTNRTPEVRAKILAKVREYKALSPEQRALRLEVTELRWYLRPLLALAPTNRPALLAQVPPALVRPIEDRLQQWDRLPGPVQQELLDNEQAITYFAEMAVSSPEQQSQMLTSLSSARRQKLQAGIHQWQALSEEQRQKLTGRFNQFFELTEPEKQETLSRLSEPERRQIAKTLEAYGKLSSDQRLQCLHSFEKFTTMSLEERQLFLKNAERWKLLSASERQAWRDLVGKISAQPPLPPGLNQPPLPPPVRPKRHSLAETNQQ